MKLYIVATDPPEAAGVVRAESEVEAVTLVRTAILRGAIPGVAADELGAAEVPVEGEAEVIAWTRSHPDEIAAHRAAVMRRFLS
jgi:hypothetical protein